jgi:tetratricopeptide (TPR) repeat protein
MKKGIRQEWLQGPAALAIYLVSMALLGTFVSCALKGNVYHTKAASWEGLDEIAVRGFYGRCGEILRQGIYARLGEVAYFRPTDPLQFCPLGDLSLDTLEEVQFLQTLEGLQANAVITGHAAADIHDTHGVDTVQVKEGTGYYKKARDESGHWVDAEIERTVVRTMAYVVRKASLSVEYQVFDLKAKKIVDAGEFTETWEKKFGGKKDHGLPGHELADLPPSDETLKALSTQAARRMVARLSRMKLATVIKLDHGKNQMVKHGVQLAKKANWEEAVRIWKEVVRRMPDNGAAYYNLGVAHEGLGDKEGFRTARDLYQKAATLGGSDIYARAIMRVEHALSRH